MGITTGTMPVRMATAMAVVGSMVAATVGIEFRLFIQ
jgi:hypothetical protein